MLSLTVNQIVLFADEPESPYTVRGVSERFAVLTRPATPNDYVDFEMEPPDPEKEVEVVYSIVDLVNYRRGPDHWILGKYNYNSDSGIQLCLKELESGECQISRRNSCDVHFLDLKGNSSNEISRNTGSRS